MNLRRFLVVTVLALTACKPPFNAGVFGSTEALYRGRHEGVQRKALG